MASDWNRTTLDAAYFEYSPEGFSLFSWELAALCSIRSFQGHTCVLVQHLYDSWRNPLRALASRLGALWATQVNDGSSIDVQWFVLKHVSNSYVENMPDWWENLAIPISGYPLGGICLIGEALSKRAVTPWPFHHYQGASLTIHQALEDLHPYFRLVNATLPKYPLDPKARVNPELQEQALMLAVKTPTSYKVPPITIALGGIALRQLQQKKIYPRYALMHPAYVTRFHHSWIPCYTELIRRIAYDLPLDEPFMDGSLMGVDLRSLILHDREKPLLKRKKVRTYA